MSGPIVPPLTVSDVADGGAVTGRPITTIEVTSGTLSVSGRTATLATGGGGGSGTVTSITAAADSGTGTAITTSGTFTFTGSTGITTSVSGTTVTIVADNNGDVTAVATPVDNQLAVWTSATSIEGDANLTWDGSTLTVAGALDIDNIKIDGNTISSTDTDGAIDLSPDGAGVVTMYNAYRFPTAVTASNDYVLTAQTDGTTAWAEVSGGSGATRLNGLSDVLIDTTEFADSILIQPNSDGLAPTTGTLSGATKNVGIGSDCLLQLTTGDHNICLGSEAGRGFTGATKNISIGGNSNWGGGNQANNVAVGYNAMSGPGSGADNNVGIGFGALTAVTGDENTGVGSAAGNNILGGEKNLCLGVASGNITTGSNNIIIGGADADSATGDDQLVISSGDGTPVWIKGDSAGALTINGAYTLPTAVTGSNDYVLTAQTDGTTAWAAVTASVPDPLRLGSGSAATPTYSFTSDTDTGFFLDGSNSISMTGGGARQMTFQPNGLLRLGDGTNAAQLSTYSTNLVINTDAGADSGSITLQQGANQDILIEPDGTGKISFYTGANAWTIENGQGAANQVLTTDGAGAATWEDAGGGGGIASVLPLIGSTGADQYNVGTAMPWGNSTTGTQTMIGFGGQPHAFPFIAPQTGTVNEIGLRVTTAEAGMSAYVAIYSNDANNLPSTLLGYATVALDSTGNIFDNSLSANPSLVAGTAYWYTIHGDAAMYNAVIQSNLLANIPDLGITSGLESQIYSIEDGATTQYAVPPATLTPNTLNSSITRPYVGLKYA